MRFYRHKAHKGIYRHLGSVKLQASDVTKLKDGAEMVLYLGENNQRHVRLKTEFEDGRFEYILSFNPIIKEKPRR